MGRDRSGRMRGEREEWEDVTNGITLALVAGK